MKLVEFSFFDYPNFGAKCLTSLMPISRYTCQTSSASTAVGKETKHSLKNVNVYSNRVVGGTIEKGYDKISPVRITSMTW